MHLQGHQTLGTWFSATLAAGDPLGNERTCGTFGCQDWLLGGAFAHSDHKKGLLQARHTMSLVPGQYDPLSAGVAHFRCQHSWIKEHSEQGCSQKAPSHVGALWAHTLTLQGRTTTGQRRAGLSLTAGQSLQSAA